VYLYLAIFWLVVGAVIQIFWTDLKPRMNIPIGRSEMGFICFLLFSYSFIRWRMVRMLRRAREDADSPPPRRHRAEQPIDPTFDFSDKKPNDDATR
jgi:hypothetical protein